MDEVWSINRTSKDASNTWHSPPWGLLLTARLALGASRTLPGSSQVIDTGQSEPSDLHSTPHKCGYYHDLPELRFSEQRAALEEHDRPQVAPNQTERAKKIFLSLY